MTTNVTLYGKTSQEISAEKSLECREIVAKILDFGVTQGQIIQIIKLLSLEIENRDTMLAIKACLESINNINDQEESKIICSD